MWGRLSWASRWCGAKHARRVWAHVCVCVVFWFVLFFGWCGGMLVVFYTVDTVLCSRMRLARGMRLGVFAMLVCVLVCASGSAWAETDAGEQR